MQLNTRRPLSELQEFYTEHLAKYKTSAAKKAAMTKDIKSQEIWVADVQEAVNGDNWLHGERFFKVHLTHYTRELELMKDIRTAIGIAVGLLEH